MGSSSNRINVSKALELVRNSETGEVHPGVDATLEQEVANLWHRIQQRPNTYIMDKQEFAVFNYFRGRGRFGDTLMVRQAVERFWNNHKADASHTNGYSPR
ncbi:hypothetical protein MMC19_006373 [Ptychographa xylographoides]|nr:hypothetical protein [Ptychographa xylographoides]